MPATQTSGAGSLASLIQAFGPMFLGTGKTTTTTSPDQEALAVSRGISSQALSNADNAEQVTNDIVNRIITKNANAFGSTLAASHVAGLYNSTTMSQLAGEAQASSSAETAKAVLDYRTGQQAIASRTSGDILSASKTQTQQTAPTVDPMVSMLLGGGATAYSAYKNRDLIRKFFSGGTEEDGAGKLLDPITGKPTADALGSSSQRATDAAFGSGGSTTGAESLQELGTTLPGAETEQAGALTVDSIGALSANQTASLAEDTSFAKPAADTSSSAADGVSSTTDALTAEDLASNSDAAGGQLIDAGTGEIATGAGAAETGASVSEGVDAADTTASAIDATSGLEGAGGPYLSTAIGLAEIISGDDYGGMETIASAGTGSIMDAAINNLSIICQELKKQGRLSHSLARRSLWHFRKYKDVSREAYYIWAKPSVQHLQKFPQSSYSRALSIIFNLRAKLLIGDKNIYTYGAYALVSSVSIFCGLFILPVRTAVDSYLMNRYLKHLYRSF